MKKKNYIIRLKNVTFFSKSRGLNTVPFSYYDKLIMNIANKYTRKSFCSFINKKYCSKNSLVPNNGMHGLILFITAIEM